MLAAEAFVESIVRAEIALDHLLLGIADLSQGIDWVQEQTGVRASMGGRHPGAGTRNALLSLGSRQYLEILAIDPEQIQAGWMADLVRNVIIPRLVAWAVAVPEIDSVVRKAASAGYRIEGPNAGARLTPHGSELRWKTARINSDLGNVIPFFIEWDRGIVHPSEDSPPACRLERLEISHPEPSRVSEMLANLAISASVSLANTPGITALIDTPKGQVRI